MSRDIFQRFREGADKKPSSQIANPGSKQVREVEVLAAVDRVPALPVVVNQILTKVGDHKASASDLERMITQDLVIAGKLLKLVNSPFYALPNQVTSLSQAVAIVGFGSLRSLVLAASAGSLLQLDLHGHRFLQHGLWINAMVTAGLASELAGLAGRNREQRDEYFTAGLLRDVGILVIGPFLDRLGLGLPPAGPEAGDVVHRERAAIGFDHAWAGERVAEKWSLPTHLRFIIGKHHRVPPDCPPEMLDLLAGVRLAERLAFKFNVGLAEDHPFDRGIDPALISAAGINTDQFKQLVAKVPELVAASAREEI